MKLNALTLALLGAFLTSFAVPSIANAASAPVASAVSAAHHSGVKAFNVIADRDDDGDDDHDDDDCHRGRRFCED